MISAIVLAAVAAGTTMVPLFQDGVRDLGGDVRDALETGSVGGIGGGGDGANGGTGGRPQGDGNATTSDDDRTARPNETMEATNAVEYASPLGGRATETIETRERIVMPNLGRPVDG